MEQIAYYDPLLFKFPKGTISKGTEVKFEIEVSETQSPNEVYLMIKHDDEADYFYEKMQKNENKYQKNLKFSRSGHFWYNFKLVFNDYSLFVSKTYDNYSYVSDNKGEDFLQLVTEEEYKCTNSMQGGIIYQIFVDRFCKVGEVKPREPLVLREDWGGAIKKNTTDPIKINEEVFGGNFKGITSKLDYLKNLGVTVIYMCPISEAYSNHKYDTANYMNVDDMFGSEEDFKELIDKAKAKGIKIVIDGVYNHTGSDSIYFNKKGRYDELGAYQSQDSKYYSWFDFINYPDEYMTWWGIDTLPKVKGECTEFQNYIAGDGGVIEKFMKLGVSGVRLDVVDEIPDSFVKMIEKKVHEFGKDNIVMGEVWEDAGTKIAYSTRKKYFAENELNTVMNYPIKESILNYIKFGEPFELVSTTRMLQNNYPKVVQDNLMNFLTTHDTGRFRSEIEVIAGGDKELADKLMKIASALTFTVSGVPSIFYGDEYGMENNDGSSRGCFDWQNYQNDIFEWYKKLSQIRKLRVMKDGDMNILYAKEGKFIFERVNENERVLVMTNLGDAPLSINLNKGNFVSFLTGDKIERLKLKKYEIEIIIDL